MTTPHEDTQITPAPSRTEIARVRRTKKRRTIGISIAATLTVALLAGGAGIAGSAAHAAAISFKTDAGLVEDARDVKIESTADTAAGAGRAAIDDAADSVDTAKLASYVHKLENPSSLSYSVVTTLASKTASEVDAVKADTAAAKKAAAEAKKRAEEQAAAERAAAEEAAEEAARQEEQRQQEQEQQEVPQPASSGGDGSPQGAQAIAQEMASSEYGWGSDQFGCLVSLWDKESGWSTTAANPSSGAYGIPQALPGNKMASAGSDWQTNAATQIAWGLDYISQVYGTPCAAWGHSQATNWY